LLCQDDPETVQLIFARLKNKAGIDRELLQEIFSNDERNFLPGH